MPRAAAASRALAWSRAGCRGRVPAPTVWDRCGLRSADPGAQVPGASRSSIPIQVPADLQSSMTVVSPSPRFSHQSSPLRPRCAPPRRPILASTPLPVAGNLAGMRRKPSQNTPRAHTFPGPARLRGVGRQPPTKGRAGGKLPAGKTTGRIPARSFSAASRKAAKNAK